MILEYEEELKRAQRSPVSLNTKIRLRLVLTMTNARDSDMTRANDTLKQGNDGVPVAEICRKAGNQPGDLFQLEEEVRRHAAALRRLKQLEDENSKLKKIVADLSLDREMLQDIIRRKL